MVSYKVCLIFDLARNGKPPSVGTLSCCPCTPIDQHSARNITGTNYYLLEGMMVHEVMKAGQELGVRSLQCQAKDLEIYPVYLQSRDPQCTAHRPKPPVCDCFHTPVAVLSGCDRNSMQSFGPQSQKQSLSVSCKNKFCQAVLNGLGKYNASMKVVLGFQCLGGLGP